MHLSGRRDVQDVYTGGIGEAGGVAGDQRDIGATLGGDPRHRVSLFTGAAVANEAHRVQRLTGSAGADKNLRAAQVVGNTVGAGQ